MPAAVPALAGSLMAEFRRGEEGSRFEFGDAGDSYSESESESPSWSANLAILTG
jgi:hypothetical protein